jgi:polar amino acid transport system ATP-binding protein
MAIPVISAVNVSKSFGTHKVLDDVSLDVSRGEVVCMLGRSGSGKTTLLRCLNMLERPDSGAVFLDGELMGFRQEGGRLHELAGRAEARQRRRLGMVFQQFNLFPHMTAAENVCEAPVHVLGRDRAEALEQAHALLARVGLKDKAAAFPEALSGGQQQRVAIARALAMEPEALLFDEPTSALDPEMVSEVLQVIGSLVEEGRTIVIVTHEIGFAREVCDRFVFMENGRIVEEGSPDVLISGGFHAATQEFMSKVL